MLASPLEAQAPNFRTPPHIGFAYPAGGRIGSTFTISIGGQNLNGTTAAFVSNSAVVAKVIGYDRPMTQKEFNDLREKIQTLQEKRAAALGLPGPQKQDAKGEARKRAAADRPAAGPVAPNEPSPAALARPAVKPTWTDDDQKQLVALREQMARRPNRQGNPAIAETVTLEVTVPPGVAVGNCELRLKTPAGLSNPAILQMADLPEVTKPVVTATTNPPPRPKQDVTTRATRPQPTDVEISLPTVVNGQILPGAVDRYRFAATRGQHLTIAVSARALIPYLADAVPGWFQATVALYDSTGREVGYADSYRFNPDPVLSYEIPGDGTYALEIHDSIYRGREDFVYRIAIGQLPFVSSIFPLGGPSTQPGEFEPAGWNLPGRSVTLNAADKEAGTYLVSVRNRGTLSNSVRVALDDERACRSVEPNDTVAGAQPVSLPIVIDGRIEHPGDSDVFRFEGKAGQELVAEVFARRLGSPLDSILTLTDAAGRQLATNDDCEDKGAGLMTHHADSRIAVKLPGDGTYYVSVADVEHNGGSEFGYRLRVGPPRPAFELRVVPSAINVRSGGFAPLTVYALRRDGFSGDITLALDEAPWGFALNGARIPAGQDHVQVTLAAPDNAALVAAVISMSGTAVIGGKSVVETAVPADDMMQAFAYHHLVPAQQLLVDVTGRTPGRWRWATDAPVKIPLGSSATINLIAPMPRGLTQPEAEFVETPTGLSIRAINSARDSIKFTVTCDPATAKVGQQGNLVFNVSAERENARGAKTQQKSQRIPLGCAPALPFEIVAPTAL